MKQKPLALLLKLSERDKQSIIELADRWQLTMAATVRMAVRECLKRENKLESR